MPESDMSVLHQVCERLWREGHTSTSPLLRRCLQRFDPHTAPEDKVLLHAALLYLPTAVADEDDTEPVVLDWVFYAWRTAVAVHGSHHPRAMTATELLARVLRRQTGASVAISLYRGLTNHYQLRERHDEHARVGLALADTLHSEGACRQAHRIAECLLREWAPHHGGRPELGPVLLLHTLRMLDACGRVDAARSLLAAHVPLLATDDAVTREAVAALALILLGRADEITRHRSRCGVDEAGPRPTFTEVRRLFLAALTGDAHYGDPGPEPDGPPSDGEGTVG